MECCEIKAAVFANTAGGDTMWSSGVRLYSSLADAGASISRGGNTGAGTAIMNLSCPAASETTEIVRSVLSEVMIYVLESDITAAQESVRANVKKPLFLYPNGIDSLR